MVHFTKFHIYRQSAQKYDFGYRITPAPLRLFRYLVIRSAQIIDNEDYYMRTKNRRANANAAMQWIINGVRVMQIHPCLIKRRLPINQLCQPRHRSQRVVYFDRYTWRIQKNNPKIYKHRPAVILGRSGMVVLVIYVGGQAVYIPIYIYILLYYYYAYTKSTKNYNKLRSWCMYTRV